MAAPSPLWDGGIVHPDADGLLGGQRAVSAGLERSAALDAVVRAKRARLAVPDECADQASAGH